MNKKITKTIVEAVMNYKEKYPKMKQSEIALLVGIAPSSVSNILNGMYEYMLNEDKENTSEGTNGIKSEIPYEEYKKLVTCELAIKELISQAKASTKEDGLLFIDYHSFSFIINNYFPEEFENRLDELSNSEGMVSYDEQESY